MHDLTGMFFFRGFYEIKMAGYHPQAELLDIIYAAIIINFLDRLVRHFLPLVVYLFSIIVVSSGTLVPETELFTYCEFTASVCLLLFNLFQNIVYRSKKMGACDWAEIQDF